MNKENTMSKMSDLMLAIVDDANEGILSFQEIARKYEVPVDWVEVAVQDYNDFLCSLEPVYE